MKPTLTLFVFAVLTASAAAQPRTENREPRTAAKPPNILFIVSEDNSEQIGFYARFFYSEHLHMAAGWEHVWSDIDAEDQGDHVFASVSFSFGAEDLLDMWNAGAR